MLLPPLGLYIHLPWCQRKCPYCDFNSHETTQIPEAQYITALLDDLEQDLPLLGGRSVETLFIGGGTPSLFSGSAIQTLMQGIAQRVPMAEGFEATLEANPGSAEAAKFKDFRNAGINRLSLGVQSFSDVQLEALGRVHNSDQAHFAIESAHAAGFANFNIDLMHGLPEQSYQDAAQDLKHALEHEPTHISWYQLTVEPNTVFYAEPPILPSEDALADIQEQGEQLLDDAGFQQYEVSAYAEQGVHCRHNHNYWSFGDYVGIGAGAHSKITGSDGSIRRYARTRQPQAYLSSSAEDRRCHERKLDNTDRVGEFMLNGLRLNEGFSHDTFSERTGLELATVKPVIDSLHARGLLLCTGERTKATPTGRRFLDSVVAEFFPDNTQ